MRRSNSRLRMDWTIRERGSQKFSDKANSVLPCLISQSKPGLQGPKHVITRLRSAEARSSPSPGLHFSSASKTANHFSKSPSLKAGSEKALPGISSRQAERSAAGEYSSSKSSQGAPSGHIGPGRPQRPSSSQRLRRILKCLDTFTIQSANLRSSEPSRACL